MPTVEEIREYFSREQERTHGETCWKWHAGCVAALLLDEIERLRARVEELERENEELRAENAHIEEANAAFQEAAEEIDYQFYVDHCPAEIGF